MFFLLSSSLRSLKAAEQLRQNLSVGPAVSRSDPHPPPPAVLKVPFDMWNYFGFASSSQLHIFKIYNSYILFLLLT